MSNSNESGNGFNCFVDRSFRLRDSDLPRVGLFGDSSSMASDDRSVDKVTHFRIFLLIYNFESRVLFFRETILLHFQYVSVVNVLVKLSKPMISLNDRILQVKLLLVLFIRCVSKITNQQKLEYKLIECRRLSAMNKLF